MSIKKIKKYTLSFHVREEDYRHIESLVNSLEGSVSVNQAARALLRLSQEKLNPKVLPKDELLNIFGLAQL